MQVFYTQFWQEITTTYIIKSISENKVSSKIVIDGITFKDITDIEIKKKIKIYCSKKLDKFKVPVKIQFVDKIA